MEQLDKVSFAKSYLESRRLPLYIFSQLQQNISPEIAINMIAMEGEGQISVRGQAMQLSDVFKFVSTMEKIKIFRDIQTKSTRKKKVKDKTLTEFEIAFAVGQTEAKK